MTFARVVGTVISTVRSDGLVNVQPSAERREQGNSASSGPDLRYLLVELTDQQNNGKGEFLVALDSVGANRGQLVLLSQGSSCRWSTLTDDRPIDALIVAIVDTIDENDRIVYASGVAE